ncbi:MAG: hypothetical protein IJ205_09290 [Bacteroidales bacterium]|nr:hypothetical protein [Bacteroidales bacterium]
MKRILFYFAVAMMAAAVSCTDKPMEDEILPSGSGPFRIELKGDPHGPGTRITEAEDASAGLKTSWEAGETIKAMYFKGGSAYLAELTSPSGNDIFSGEVESGEDVQAFRTSDLYCVSSSSKITTRVSGDNAECTVDFSGQDGSLGNVAAYELMFVKGKASQVLHFDHMTSVIKLTFTGLSGNEVSAVHFSFTPSDDVSGQAMFASQAIYTFGPDGNTVVPDDDIFYDMPQTHLPVENGRATVWLVIPARGKLAGELSVSLTCGDHTYRRYIKLAGKSFKACNVVARSETLSDDDLVPKVGDYVYSDGSWGPLVYYEDKWPQAVIFSNYTSPEDRAAGYTHGYAMALRDAAWPTAWAPESEVLENPDYPQTENVFETVAESAPLLMMENLAGLTTCTILNGIYLSDYCQGNYYGVPGFEYTRARAAIPCAMRYGKEDWVYAFSTTENITEFEAPEGTSGWFLPSVGQWYLCLANLAGIDPNDLELTSSGDQVTELAWRFSSSSERQDYLDTFASYFSSNSYYNSVLAQYVSSGRMVSTTFYLPYNGQLDWYLWACDEATSDGTAAVVYLNSTDIVFKYVAKQTGEDTENGYAARSILAF